MNGIDISNWQKGIDLSKVPCDFVICKATGGSGYVSPDFKRQVEQSLSLGKLTGVYHFALDGFKGTTPEAEAKHFLNTIKPYLGKVILVLDWEADAVNLGAEWAKKWLDYIYAETGIRAFIYMSKGVASSDSWADIAKIHPLWMAQYADYNPQIGYNSDPWGAKTCGKWGSNISIRQYTSNGFLDGWNNRLDLNLAYFDKDLWHKMCGKTEDKPSTPSEPATQDVIINCTEVAKEVIAGKWGVGLLRKNKLGLMFYNKVQDEVNRILKG